MELSQNWIEDRGHSDGAGRRRRDAQAEQQQQQQQQRRRRFDHFPGANRIEIEIEIGDSFFYRSAAVRLGRRGRPIRASGSNAVSHWRWPKKKKENNKNWRSVTQKKKGNQNSVGNGIANLCDTTTGSILFFFNHFFLCFSFFLFCSFFF